MPGRVNKIKRPIGPFRIAMNQRRRLRLDGNPPLALQIHGIQNLLLHFTLTQPAAMPNQQIGQR